MRIAVLGFIGSVGLMLSSCGSMSIVNKENTTGINKVAIVSLYSNRTIYNRQPSQGGSGYLSGLVALKNIAQNGIKAYDDLNLKDDVLIGHVLTTWSQELSKVNGWTVVPYSKLRENKAFQGFVAKTPPIPQEKADKTYISPTGMQPYFLSNGEEGPKLVELGKLAKQLQVDAVAVISVDMGYTMSSGIGSTGTAVGAVGANIKIVTKAGEYAVSTPERKKGEEIYETSEKSIAMAGNLAYTPELEAMLKEAVAKTAVYYRTEINNNL